MAARSIISGRWRSASVWVLYAAGLVPAVWCFYLGASGNLGADPVKAFEHSLGLWALRFIILTIAVSPLRDLGGPSFIRYRRALGLLSFYYAAMHFAVYLLLDQAFSLTAVFADIVKRPFIMLGMASLLLLVPLALTSNMFSIKRLGRHWSRLHKLVYIVCILVGLHYALSSKILAVEHYVYLALIAALLAYRVVRVVRPRSRKRTFHMVVSN